MSHNDMKSVRHENEEKRVVLIHRVVQSEVVNDGENIAVITF